MSRPDDFTRRTWLWRLWWAFLIGVAVGIFFSQLPWIISQLMLLYPQHK